MGDLNQVEMCNIKCGWLWPIVLERCVCFVYPCLVHLCAVFCVQLMLHLDEIS